jgi:hypothetical protein
MNKTLCAASLMLLTVPLSAQKSAVLSDATVIFKRAKAATAIVMAGEGAGRLNSIATGVVISKNGILLTAYHAVKGASEVQVRLADGEIFDNVELLGVDQRRDVAALRISAGGLAPLPLGSAANLVQGDPIYAVTNANGLSWSATEGIISAVRLANEVPGAGTGYELLQFTAPVAPGSSGGALVDRTGALVGIIVRGGGSTAFAIPIESVENLPEDGHATAFGSGALLQLPATQAAEIPQSSAAIANSNPTEILKNAKTIYIHSKTMFLTVDTLERALESQKEWPELGLTIVADPRVADLLVEIDRPLFTYVHTFVIVDKRTSIVLSAGKVTAYDGTIASGGLAKDIVKIFAAARLSPKSGNEQSTPKLPR